MAAARGPVRVRVPASTANLGPGFDTLGMALSLYAWIEMKESDRTRIRLYGRELDGVPADKSNLIYKIAQRLFDEAGVRLPELEIAMHSDIPLTRGLGSSASAIVGALAAANGLIGEPFSADDLFQMATRLEDHPDNVGASLFGGIVTAVWDGSRASGIRIEPPDDLAVLAAVPDFRLSTDKARHLLPKSVSRKDAVFNVGHASLLTAALAAGRLDLLAVAMQDRLHQPYRTPLVPGMDKILREAADHGALGAALSGAGPAIICFIDRKRGAHAELELFLQEAFREAGVTARTMRLEPDREGVRLLVPGNPLYAQFDALIKGEVRT